MTAALKGSAYDALFKKISGRIERARGEAARAVDLILLEMNRSIGKDILEAKKSGDPRTGYGKQFIPRLSRELTQKYGRGFSESNLENMRLFCLAYPISQKSGKLTLSRYLMLSTTNTTGCAG